MCGELGQESLELACGAESGIEPAMVDDVVAVSTARHRCENRRNVEGLYAECVR